MSCSTDAILFYGVCWSDEMVECNLWGQDQQDDDDPESWDARYTRLVAGKKPGPPNWIEHTVVKDSPCEISSHCASECPMPYIAHREAHVTAWRGNPKEIPAGLTSTDTTRWDSEIRAFCSAMGINIEGMRIGWWLVSSWG